MNSRKFISVVLSALLGLTTLGLAQASGTEATVTQVTGMATVKLPDGSTPAVVVGMKLPQGTEITTGEGSQVMVQAHDGIVAVASAKTTITIDELSVSPNGTRNATIGLKSGNLASSLDPSKKAINNYSVRTPKGVAAARGTTFSVNFNGQTLSVTVVAGVVQSFTLNGVSLSSTTPGNVSNSDGETSTTQTLAEAIANTPGAGDAVATLAAAVAAVSTNVADVTAVITTIASSAGTSEAANQVVAASTASAAATAVNNPTLTASAAAAGTSVASAVVGAAVQANAGAAAAVVSTTAAAVATASNTSVADAAASLTQVANQTSGVTLDAAVMTQTATAVQTTINSQTVQIQNNSTSTQTTPATEATIIITTPTPIDPGVINVSPSS